jgi:glutamine synthetase
MPTTLAEAVGLLDGSAFARAAFGDRVIDHYVNSGRYEVQAFESAVTDWEMVRSFERS